jgi:prepilin-type processing-associated H-X9-DG protein
LKVRNHLDDLKWGNLPASFHADAANISWADGHVERHRWVGDTVRPPVKGGAGGGLVPFPTTGYVWLREHTSFKLN